MLAQADTSSRARVARYVITATIVGLLAVVGEHSVAARPEPDGAAAAAEAAPDPPDARHGSRAVRRRWREAPADVAAEASTSATLPASDGASADGAADVGHGAASVDGGGGAEADARGAQPAAGSSSEAAAAAADGDAELPTTAEPAGVTQSDAAPAAAATAAEQDATAPPAAAPADSGQPLKSDSAASGGDADARPPADGTESAATNSAPPPPPTPQSPLDAEVLTTTPAAAVHVQLPPVLAGEVRADSALKPDQPIAKSVLYSKTFDKENRCLYCNGEMCRGIDKRMPSVCYSTGPCWVSKTFETYAEYVRINNQSLGCAPTLTAPAGFDCVRGTATACTLTGSTCLCCCNGDACNGDDYCDKLLAMSSASREHCRRCVAYWSLLFAAATFAAALLPDE